MTPKSRDDQLIHSRRSRDVWGDFPDDSTWQRLRAPLGRAHTFYVSMLYQDLGHQLYLGGYQPDDTFRVEVLGDDTERVRSLLSEALGGRSHWDIVRAVRDFFQHTGRTMLLCGSATYEIDYLADPESLQAERFRFAEIPPGTVETRGGQRHQYVPAGIVSVEPTWLKLDPPTIVEFAFERSAWAELDPALDALVELALANTSAAELLIEAYQEDLPFDSGLQHKLIEHAVAAVTRPLGWDARQSLLFQWPEPLLLWRALRFRRFTIVLRDQIHGRINEALQPIGQKVGIDAQLAFHGLLSLDDIDEALDDVTTGRRPYGALWEVARRG
jgi:hypothetical protein